MSKRDEMSLIRKLIGILAKENGEATFRALMANLPVTIDEEKLISAKALKAELRVRAIQLDKEVKGT